jgi:hypothetical protein
MNFELKWAIHNLQRASNELQEALAQTNRWTQDERERLIYCKTAIDAIVTEKLK